MKKTISAMFVAACLIACLCACDLKHEHMPGEWKYSGTEHWRLPECDREYCAVEDNVYDWGSHVDDDANLVCDVCGCAEMEDPAQPENNGSSQLWHTECEYCGKLGGEDRWFIAKVVSASSVKPLGSGCFEAVSAGDAGMCLNVSNFAPGDIVRITYNGMIMESYPVQIHADSIEPAK